MAKVTAMNLVDLIDVNIMQQVQDAFSRFTGMAALMTDAHGTPVTKGSGFTRFCMELTRNSELGCRRCEECDRGGALQTLHEERASSYYCHAGLVDFAAPILLDGQFIGSFIGGQVRTEEIDEEMFRHTAEVLGINPEEYIRAAKETRILDKETIDRAARFLSELAAIFSDMAYKNYIALRNSQKIERAARSQTSYILGVGQELQEKMEDWLAFCRQALEERNQEEMQRSLNLICSQGSEVLSTIENTLEYMKLIEGKMELVEAKYHVRNLLNKLLERVEALAKGKPIHFSVHVQKDVPEYMIGDSGHIGQILFQLLQNSVEYKEETKVALEVSIQKISYSTWLTFVLKDTGRKIEPQVLEQIQKFFRNKDLHYLKYREATDIGLPTIASLVKQLNGRIEVDCGQESGVTFRIHIPQLEYKGDSDYGI